MAARRVTWWMTGRMAVRAICTIALMLTAFAHKPVALANYDGGNLAAYVLPDGSLPILCLTDLDGDGRPDGVSTHCEFCRIASSVDLPEPPTVADRGGLGGIVAAVLRPGEDYIPPSGVPPSAPPRGPPSFLI